VIIVVEDCVVDVSDVDEFQLLLRIEWPNEVAAEYLPSIVDDDGRALRMEEQSRGETRGEEQWQV